MIGELRSSDPETVGPFRLLGRLGAGGMGQVFLGQSAGGRLVAVKVIRPELAGEPGFRRRFAHEVTAARNVSGLFTALVVDADPDAAVPWLATAYVAGPSLAETVDEYGPLPPCSVTALAAGLAEGLEAIHGAGVVHRDLKPANVLLAQDGPRVIDFGISRAVETTMLTQTGMVMGSPGFLSPEQADGADVGPASDIFSLGAVLTFAATGAGPFGSGPAPALIYRVVNRAPDLDRVPADLRGLIERCLAKDPASRPGPAELLAELGDGRLAADWLPEPVAGTLDRYTAPTQGAGPDTSADQPPAPAGRQPPARAGDGAGQGPAGPHVAGAAAGGPGRRHRWRLAAAAALVLVGGGATAFALDGPGQSRPLADSPALQAAAQAAAATPASSAGPSASARPAVERIGADRAPARHTVTATATATVTVTATAKHPPATARGTQPPATGASGTTASPAQPVPSPQPTQSAQPAAGTVPAVIGESLSAATADLEASGFSNLPYRYGCYGSASVLAVVAESPGAGTQLALTSPVSLDLQAGNCVTMPDITGYSLSDAESTLENDGFAASAISYQDECYGAYPASQVVTQSPDAGTSDGSTGPISLGVEASSCG